LALVLHELGTNAAKHGALRVAHGWIAIEAGLVAGKKPGLRLVWRERGGPAVAAPAHQGFGTRLLHELIVGRHQGSLELDWHVDGLVCTIRLPLDDPG
jgi:two-component sensor histidine kinase